MHTLPTVRFPWIHAGGREEYASLIAPVNPSLLDLLRRYPSCQPPLAPLLDALPPLAPRLYSISSSPLQHGTSAHVAFSVVRIGQPPANVSSAAVAGSGGAHTGGGKGITEVEGRWGVATGPRSDSTPVLSHCLILALLNANMQVTCMTI